MDKNKKKILITAIGAPPHGYTEVNWQFKGKEIPTPLPIIAIASVYEVDHILILGTKEALDEKRVHHQQLQQELKKYQLDEKFSFLEIGALNSREEFWLAFETVAQNRLFKKEEVELYVDLTFGYRIQPMLIFLAAYFLNETAQNVKLKKLLYGMDKAQPPHILDMTELVYLLDWLKGVQMFVQGGSAKALMENIKEISKKHFPDVANSFEDFTDAYGFNYVSYLKEKANTFKKHFNNKKFIFYAKENYPVLSLIAPFINDFVKIFTIEDKLTMQLQTAKRNFEDNAYSRSIMILREAYITMLTKAFSYTRNKDRQKIERLLINRVFWYRTERKDKPDLSPKELYLAKETYKTLSDIFDEESISQFYDNWEQIREIRNGAGHIKNINKGNQIDFSDLKKILADYLKKTENLFNYMRQFFPECQANKRKIEMLLKGELESKLFIIVNEGLHPILPKLKEQFGEHIHVEVLTAGNVHLDAEKEIAQKCKTLAGKYHDHKIYLVPSGYPYLAVTAFTVLQQTLARYPIWLQYDRERGRYIEKNLDPRNLIN